MRLRPGAVWNCAIHVDGSTGHATDIVDVSTDDAEVAIGERSAEEQAGIRSGLGEASSEENGLQVEPELAACILLSIECAVEFQYVISIVVVAGWLCDEDRSSLGCVRVGIANVECRHARQSASSVERK